MLVIDQGNKKMISHAELTSIGFVKSTTNRGNLYCAEDNIILDNYSDGSEIDILNIVRSVSDLGVMSEELKSLATTWPRQYHLGRQRANLLAPLQSILTGSVLEIGAGCGGLTRALGETTLQITSIEPSNARSQVAAERVRDLENVTVINCSLSRFQISERFDVVVLVGVLEYSRVNFGCGLTGSTIEDTLEQVRTKLLPTGKLVLAIENQLGLKYLCGYAEDHVGRPMHGVEDLYTNSSVVTFGKIELQSLLDHAGFQYQDWWYPWPDYKLPTSFLSDRGAKKYGREFGPLIADAALTDTQQPAGRHFSVQRSLPVFARNGLCGDLANSFLVVASQTELLPSSVVSVYVNNSLLPKFAKRVEFRETDSDVIKVFRTNLYSDDSVDTHIVKQLLVPVEDFIYGERWSDRLIKVVSKQYWSLQEIFAWTDKWWNAVICIDGSMLLHKHVYIENKFLDAIPRNLILQDSETWRFFDLEWIYQDPIPVDFFIFRAMLASFSQIQRFEIFATGEIKLLDLIGLILERYGFPSSKTRLREMYLMETNIYKSIYGPNNSSICFSELKEITISEGYRR